MSIIGERRKYFKKEARFFLRYNYIKQIFMTAVVVLLTFGLNAVKANIMSLFRLSYAVYYMPLGILFDLLAFFITAPLYVGIIYVNAKLFEGETVSVAEMFHYFASSSNLTECYRFIVSMAAKLAVFAVPFLIFGAMLSKLRELFQLLLYGTIAVSVDIAMIGACIVYISAFLLCLVLFMRYFAAVFVFVKNPCLSMRDIIHKSARMMKKRKIESLKLLISFAAWILLSHYLAGFLYIFFTLPYIMLSYTSFLTYLLAEKGGEEFLSAPGDYIEEIAAGRLSELNELTEANELTELTEESRQFEINEINEDGEYDYYENFEEYNGYDEFAEFEDIEDIEDIEEYINDMEDMEDMKYIEDMEKTGRIDIIKSERRINYE